MRLGSRMTTGRLGCWEEERAVQNPLGRGRFAWHSGGEVGGFGGGRGPLPKMIPSEEGIPSPQQRN